MAMGLDFSRYAELYRGELFDRVLPFWLEHAPDREHGGVFTCLDRNGEVYSPDKSVWMQGRCLWMFSHLSNGYGARDEWLSIAASCKSFLDEHCFDKDGRMFFSVLGDGRPLRKRRYFFSEAFYIVGAAEYALATGDSGALEDARRVYALVRAIHRDPASDPFRVPPKTYPEARATKPFANAMILLNVADVLRRCDPERAEEYAADARAYAEEIVRDFYKPELGALLEHVAPDGSFLADNADTRVVNPGHAIEGSWFLMNEARYRKDGALMRAALDILDDSLELGWDGEYGGLHYFVDVLKKPVIALEADMKLWWPHCEALIATLTAYRETREQRYADWFETLTDYCFSRFSDRAFGEWYGYLHRDGSVSHAYKGSLYKGPFHTPRALMLCHRMLKDLAEE